MADRIVASSDASSNTKPQLRVNGKIPQEYRRLADIKNRCYNPNNHRYHNYGGRGIRVCDRWMGKDGWLRFMEDMGPLPSPRHSVDRIDPNGHYCPENCRWATPQEQQNNRNNNRLVTYQGRTETLAEWARISGVPYKTLHNRIQSGWEFEKALSTPLKGRRSKNG